jgi:hypothetical protein
MDVLSVVFYIKEAIYYCMCALFIEDGVELRARCIIRKHVSVERKSVEILTKE